MRRGDAKLTDDLPSSLRTTDPKKKGAVPGAGYLLDRAKPLTKKSGRDRQLAARSKYQATVADFHKLHLDKSGFFARYSDKTTPGARSARAAKHHAAYLAANVAHVKAIDERLRLLGVKPTGAKALKAGALRNQKLQIVQGMQRTLVRARTTNKDVADQAGAVRALAKNAKAAAKGLKAAKGNLRAANKGLSTAKDDDDVTIDLRTSGAQRRDANEVTDSRTVRDRQATDLKFARQNVKATKVMLDSARARLARLKKQQARDLDDAHRVKQAVAGVTGQCHGTVGGALRATLKVTDKTARRAVADLDRAAKSLPKQAAKIAGERLKVASYYLRSTQVDPSKTNTPKRLDKASAQLDEVDATRAKLKAGSKDRVNLAANVVSVRAELGGAYGGVRPAKALKQIDKASAIAKTDLAKDKKKLSAAQGQIGAGAVTALIKNNAKTEELARKGHFTPGVDDELYRHARTNLAATKSRDPATRAAKRHLAHVRAALKKVRPMLLTSGLQLQNGLAYTAAQMRKMGRAEVRAAQSKVSTVISGGAWLFTLGHFDMKEKMAKAGMRAARHRVGYVRYSTKRQIAGAKALAAAWDKAKKEGKAFQFLNSLRIRAVRNIPVSNKVLAATHYFLVDRLPNGRSDEGNAFRFIRGVMGGKYGSPLARSLRGSVLSYRLAHRAFGKKDMAVITANMDDGMKTSQKSLKREADDAKWKAILNLGLETALGIVLTAGIGSGAAVANAGRALNAGRVAGQVARASRGLAILKTMGVTAGFGLGLAGAQYAVKKVFGRRAAEAFGVFTNFIPIAAGQSAMQLGNAVKAAAAGGKWAQRAARASFLGTRIAYGSGQAMVTAWAAPHLVKKLGLERSEIGQIAVSIGLNALISGGIAGAAIARRSTAGYQAKEMAKALVGNLQVTGNKRALVRGLTKDIKGFLKQQEGKIPTKADLDGLKKTLENRIGAKSPELSAAIAGMVESVRISAAGAKGFEKEVGKLPTDKTTEKQVHAAVDAIAGNLLTARGSKASKAQAYADAAEYVAGRLAGSSSKKQQSMVDAAHDRAAAALIVLAAGGKTNIKASIDAVAGQIAGARKLLESGQKLDGVTSKIEAALVKQGLSKQEAQAITGQMKTRLVAELATKKMAAGVMTPEAAKKLVEDLATKSGLSDAAKKQLLAGLEKVRKSLVKPQGAPKPSDPDKNADKNLREVADRLVADGKQKGRTDDAVAVDALDTAAKYLLKGKQNPTAADRAKAYWTALGAVAQSFQSKKLPTSALHKAIDRATAVGVAASIGPKATASSTQVSAVKQAVVDHLPKLREALVSGNKTKIEAAVKGFETALGGISGLTAAQRSKILRAIKTDAVHRSTLEKLAKTQDALGAHLTPTRIAAIAKDVALKAGLDPKAASVWSRAFSAMEGVGSYLRDVFPKRYAKMTAAQKQADYIRRNPDAAPLAKLTPAEFTAAFGDGPYSTALGELAKVKGFVELARSPNAAKRAQAAPAVPARLALAGVRRPSAEAGGSAEGPERRAEDHPPAHLRCADEEREAQRLPRGVRSLHESARPQDVAAESAGPQRRVARGTGRSRSAGARPSGLRRTSCSTGRRFCGSSSSTRPATSWSRTCARSRCSARTAARTASRGCRRRRRPSSSRRSSSPTTRRRRRSRIRRRRSSTSSCARAARETSGDCSSARPTPRPSSASSPPRSRATRRWPASKCSRRRRRGSTFSGRQKDILGRIYRSDFVTPNDQVWSLDPKVARRLIAAGLMTAGGGALVYTLLKDADDKKKK